MGEFGESNLSTLLATMEPLINPGQYVYVSLDPTQAPGIVANLLAQIGKKQMSSVPVPVVAVMAESEGLTFIMDRTYAGTLNLTYAAGFVASWITLRVHSALNAVGLTAAVAQALTKAGISCNVVAAFYHDHLFVSVEDATKAATVLKELSASAVAVSPMSSSTN